jgi:D-sedoheptulose 7-phosphate isomerase
METEVMLEIAAKELNESIETKQRMHGDLLEQVAAIAQAMINTLGKGGKIVWFGNGGSAADAQHLAAEFVGQFSRVRAGLASLAFTTNTSVLTAVGNDFSFEEMFSRQVEALVTKDDLVVGISTGGGSATARTSMNVVKGIEEANKMGATTVAFLGRDGGLLKNIADYPLVIPSDNTQRIQEAHITVGHILCHLVEQGAMEYNNG